MHGYPPDWSSDWAVASSSNDDDTCIPLEKYEWCKSYLGECVQSDVEFAGFMLGLLSNVCWLVAQAPQIYKNWKNGTSESLSIAFLAAWLTGDITNLVGCLMTDTTKTQLYTAVYFCFIDGIMVAQWLYYSRKNRIAAERSGMVLNSAMLPALFLIPVLWVGSFSTFLSNDIEAGMHDNHGYQHHGTGRSLLGVVVARNRNELIGYVAGCISGFLYFTSRIPQIMTNYQRKTTEGLEPLMFVMAVLGNLFYAAGVLTKGTSTRLIIIRLPWLIGSVGTLNFDFAIVIQYFYYGTDTRTGWRDSESRRILSPDSLASDDPLVLEKQALLMPAPSPSRKHKGWDPEAW